jgi:xanthine/uracil permease
MLQNPQMARTFFLWILQGFLCCDLFGAEFAQPWHIQKELMLFPQKMSLLLLSHLFSCGLPTLLVAFVCARAFGCQTCRWSG